MTFAIAVLLKPVFVFLLFLIVIPIELAFIRYFPEGKIKTLLLRRI